MSGKVIKAHTKKLNGGKKIVHVPQSNDASRAAANAKARIKKLTKETFKR